MNDFDFKEAVEAKKSEIEEYIKKADYWENNKKIEDEKKLNELGKETIEVFKDRIKKWSTKDECPDIYAGEFEFSNGNVNKITNYIDPNTRKKNIDKLSPYKHPDYKTIVIILESPHDKEYSDLSFINPALGSTGINLSSSIISLITNVQKNANILSAGKYRIILMESIQYQCSLELDLREYPNRVIRDAVFNAIWNLNQNGDDKTKNDFVARLASYMPDVIFNLSTKNVQDLVQNEVDFYCKKINKQIEVYQGFHPSSWNKDNKNKKVWTIKSKETEF